MLNEFEMQPVLKNFAITGKNFYTKVLFALFSGPENGFRLGGKFTVRIGVYVY